MTDAERIAKLEADVAALKELVYDMARERHTALEHPTPFPGTHYRGECMDSICKQAWRLTAEEG
jgi:hypothetical protein